MTHSIKELLINLGISDQQSIVPFYPQVRDNDNISVLKCSKSEVILLSDNSHVKASHYSEHDDFTYWNASDIQKAKLATYEDDERRYQQYKQLIYNKNWLDIGTGSGGLLDKLSPLTSETIAVEPQTKARHAIRESGYTVYSYLSDVIEKDFDIITLFHVFEHLDNPIEHLVDIHAKLNSNGKLIIEVPHARDFLISFLDLEAFKAFTFWSEHLILHTRESLRLFLQKAGFKNITISGYQRYPLSNHLHWLAKEKPGGHIIWHQLNSDELEHAYSNILNKLDYTDTLIATATK
ncbi:class I SAM-dependent methyltransferase [bacterium]|nr:class I SAM-dependent methyltransferase [bacterium]